MLIPETSRTVKSRHALACVGRIGRARVRCDTSPRKHRLFDQVKSAYSWLGDD